MALVVAVNTTWIATPEMYRTEVRATGHGAANFFSRLGALVASTWLVKGVGTEGAGWALLVSAVGAAGGR